MRTHLSGNERNTNAKKTVYRYFDRLYNGDGKNNLNGKAIVYVRTERKEKPLRANERDERHSRNFNLKQKLIHTTRGGKLVWYWEWNLILFHCRTLALRLKKCNFRSAWRSLWIFHVFIMNFFLVRRKFSITPVKILKELIMRRTEWEGWVRKWRQTMFA